VTYDRAEGGGMSEVEQIRERLKNVIINTCNKIGCDNCDLKWGKDECIATELQSKEMDLMYNKDGSVK
jgi:hypothetical protein